MPIQVANGALISCSFGTTPSSLSVLPAGRAGAGNATVASIQDHVPQLNIAPFGLCTSLANPQVAAATSAALGVLTPQPCIPVTTAPWSPGAASVRIGNVPALHSACTCMCQWAGSISVIVPGQTRATSN